MEHYTNASSYSYSYDLISAVLSSNFGPIISFSWIVFLVSAVVTVNSMRLLQKQSIASYLSSSLLLRRCSGIVISASSVCAQFWYCAVLHYYGIKWSLIEVCQKHRTFDVGGLPKRAARRVAVITGGARGIGVHVVKKLLECDMHVIIGCRNIISGHNAVNQLRDGGIHSGRVEVLELDLLSLASVHAFAAKLLARQLPIHLLINNAGIMFVPHKLTKDGFESHFQVNYLGHFLLSNLLLPRMISTADASRVKGRIINVSSCAHFGGTMAFDDLQMKKFYSPYFGYMVSKFLQVVSSNGMNEELRREGAGVIVSSVHPGIVQTELYENLWWVHALQFFVQFFFKSPEQGADTILYAALSPELAHDGSHYIANSLKYSPKAETRDAHVQQLVLQVSKHLTGIELAPPEDDNDRCNNNSWSFDQNYMKYKCY